MVLGPPSATSTRSLPGEALFHYWLGKLAKAEKAILTALYEVYPDALSNEEIAGRAGYTASGGSFNNALGSLRTRELAVGYGEVRASDSLFEEVPA